MHRRTCTTVAPYQIELIPALDPTRVPQYPTPLGLHAPEPPEVPPQQANWETHRTIAHRRDSLREEKPSSLVRSADAVTLLRTSFVRLDRGLLRRPDGGELRFIA